MSTGISISSINRIKELAEEKQYAEALEILDTQNLDKSINPQFLRISGEIFRENKRYYDSRRILMKSHEMAPQGTRIIAELIQLYLELGYYTRANKYYEEYLFYSTPDDTQRDFVEYMIKKANGTDVKELASILIPILERMPDDKWNFEAVLLYDKLDRKDKALEEAQFILENFRESNYIKQVIEYIDDNLDVDKYFNIYPLKEVEEDKELFGDLIEKEDKILEADHLRMYPPEAKILLEVDDKDPIDVKPAKEKKSKKKRSKNKNSEDQAADKDNSDNDNVSADTGKKSEDDTSSVKNENNSVSDSDDEKNEAEIKLEEEEIRKKEREAALDRLLSKKLDKDAIKESAKQMVKSVSEDVGKAKGQVKKVTDTVVDNVGKAAETIGDAVGTTKVQNTEPAGGEILDGIIESVLEPPKKAVGEVVMNEELDALVPDSLEAMSADEVKEREARKEEQERLELEALEASVLIEEKKKNRRNKRKKSDSDGEGVDSESSGFMGDNDIVSDDAIVVDGKLQSEVIATVSFAELKERFLADNDDDEEEEEPLESLGFMSVVQSDVDKRMEDETPEAAEILHRMIDNKEYYTGEDSRGFESDASYDNHGFEVDDYEFDEYIDTEDEEPADLNNGNEEIYKVLEIYAENDSVMSFEEIIPESEAPVADTVEPESMWQEETIADTTEQEVEPESETPVADTIDVESETPVAETIDVETETPVADTVEPESMWQEETIADTTEQEVEPESETPVAETIDVETETPVADTVESEPMWQEETIVDTTEQEVEPESETPVAETIDVETETPVAETIDVESEAPVADTIDVESETPVAETIDVESEAPVADMVEPEPMWQEETIADTTEQEVEPEHTEIVNETSDVVEVEPTWQDEQVYDMEDEKDGIDELSGDSIREQLRFRIILTEDMVNSLLFLKESR